MNQQTFFKIRETENLVFKIIMDAGLTFEEQIKVLVNIHTRFYDIKERSEDSSIKDEDYNTWASLDL